MAVKKWPGPITEEEVVEMALRHLADLRKLDDLRMWVDSAAFESAFRKAKQATKQQSQVPV